MGKRKKRKRIKRAIKEAIVLLRVLSEGQGIVYLEVFDAGAGGGFSVGKFGADWLRDGQLCKIEEYTQKDFVDSIMSMIDHHHDGLAIRSFWLKIHKG